MKKTEYILDTMRETLSSKRMRITLYMAAVLWLAFTTQIIVNRTFLDNVKITEAFVKTNTEEMQSSIEIIAEYKDRLFGEEQKVNMIRQIAGSIGLQVDKDIKVTEDGQQKEHLYYKRARQAETEIKVISTKDDKANNLGHFIIARISILKSIQSIDKYKEMLENSFDKLGLKNKQITMQYEGSSDGQLSLEEKGEIASFLVNELQGKTVVQYDEGDIYTVYAYTGLLNEYIESMGSKVNIQIAFTYNEISNKTKIYLATPIINDSW